MTVAAPKPGTRRMRARPVLAITPVTVTDEEASCFPVVGLTPRRLRELVSLYQIPHARLGRRILVRISDIETAITEHSVIGLVATRDADADVCTEDKGPALTADDVLARLGRRRTA